jgi:hypothetical protein
MPETFTPTGAGAFEIPACPKRVADAQAEWQVHLDAGRLTPQKPTPPHIRARHAHNHRVLGLRMPKR